MLRDRSPMPQPSRLHTRPEAADWVRKNFRARCSTQTLARLASEGRGPPYVRWRNGRVLYDERELLRWGRAQLRPPSTHEKIARRDRARKRGPVAPPEALMPLE